MIDTIQISHDLQKAGFTQDQAEAIAQSFLSVRQLGLATKEDVTKLEAKIDLLKWMIGGVYALLVPILLKLFLH